jgi:hypothetical protein
VLCAAGTVVLASALGACSDDGHEAKLATYLSRLTRPLETEPRPPAAIDPLPAPRAAALQIEIDEGVLGGLDFLSLRGCALQTTVARRNSSLGRVAPPSQRLLLDLAFLREAPACIEALGDREEGALADTLEATLDAKRRQLPSRLFNATLGGLEYRDFWRGRADAAYPTNTSSTVVTALELILRNAERWLAGDYAADDTDFELALGDIALGDGGELLHALRQQAAWLRAANSAVDRRLNEGALCRPGLTPSSAPILRTVVGKYFVGSVQGGAADLEQRYHQLLAPIRQLELRLDSILPDAYRDWMNERNTLLEQARAAPATHVGRLQQLLGPCYAEFRPAGNRNT